MKRAILLIIFSILFTSCQKDEEIAPEEKSLFTSMTTAGHVNVPGPIRATKE